MTKSNTTRKIEIISGKQKRLFSLILLLDAGLDRSDDGLAKTMNCSTPTFHRLLAELRSNYDMDMSYNQSINQYEITSYGCIPDKIIWATGTILAGEKEFSESLDLVASQHCLSGGWMNLDENTIKEIDDICEQNHRISILRENVISSAINILETVLCVTGK